MKNIESDIKKYSKTIQLLPAGFARYKYVNGRFIFVEANEMFGKLLNLDYSNFAGKDMLDLFPYLVDTSLYTRYVNIVTTGEPFNEVEQISEDFGEVKYFNSHTFTNELDDLCFLFYDVTETVTYKKHLEAMTVGSSDIFFDLDVNSNKLFLTSKTFNIVDIDQKHLLKKEDFLKEFKFSINEKSIQDFFDERNIEEHIDIQTKAEIDNEFTWIRLKCKKTIRDSKAFRISGSISDISKLKDVEEDLQRKNNELSEYGHLLSHDLRTPIRKISSLANFIIEDINENKMEEVSRHAHSIIQNVDGMDALIGVLLKYADMGYHKINKEKINLNTLVVGVSNRFVNEEQDQDCLQLEILPTLNCDKVLIEQVFQNILSNSFKFKSKERPLIINVKCIQENNNFQTIVIEDNGIGFDMKQSSKVFKAFGRLHRNIPGYGIGMSMVKKIVNKHNWDITIDSKLGEGTAVSLIIPTDHIISK